MIAEEGGDKVEVEDMRHIEKVVVNCEAKLGRADG
jgi:hypothetical protein